MTLLDRFRTSSPDKHPDPNVRLAYVSSLPLEDRGGIAAIARQDDDARVRRAAVAKLMDPAALGAIAREDRDDTVRAHASDMLRDIALEAFEGIGEPEALDAVDALADVRSLAQVAKNATREIVALRASARVVDPRAWGSIARQSPVEAVRRAAFDQLRVGSEHAELLALALNGEFKDTAVAAVELITDQQHLEQIASRGKNKAASKRARALIRESEAEAQPEAEPEVPVDVPAFVPALADASAVIATTREDETERAEASEREARERREAQQADEEATRERERLDTERRALDAERRQQRLAELAALASQAVEDTDLSAARRSFNLLRREWTEIGGSRGGAAGSAEETGEYSSAATQLAESEAKLVAREQEVRAADARARREALTHLQHLLGRAEALAAKPDLSLKAAERATRDLRSALTTIPPLPTRQDVEDVNRRLKAVQAVLTPKLQELRDADDWQRWANAGIQEQLCIKMEALQAVEDPEAVARAVRELQEQWRIAADVPRAQADALWRRFKAGHDAVWPRCEAHFAAEAQSRAANLAKRIALCEKAESLAESKDWLRTADEIQKLQAEWKTIGPVPRGREKAVWERFRSACDRFFTRRHADLAERKSQWAENLSKKTALCEKVEALAESTDWDATAAEIKRLQAEWKTVGAVKKSRSEAIWQRFRSACDRFFARHSQRHDLAKVERVAAREAICAELEALAPALVEDGVADEATMPTDLVAQVRTLRGRWQQEIAARGVDPDRARALDERFAAAHARVLARWPVAFAGTDLDPDANRQRMAALVQRVEEIARSFAGPATEAVDASLSPTTRLAAMLKEALAANTIGGKVQDNSRLNAAVEEVRGAQASWSRIGPVPEQARRPLADRFQRATRAVLDRASKSAEARPAGRDGGSGSRPAR